ncbi:MAG: hypothetical protein Fur007_22980 [Rhodoferax sp.]
MHGVVHGTVRTAVRVEVATGTHAIAAGAVATLMDMESVFTPWLESADLPRNAQE